MIIQLKIYKYLGEIAIKNYYKSILKLYVIECKTSASKLIWTYAYKLQKILNTVHTELLKKLREFNRQVH